MPAPVVKTCLVCEDARFEVRNVVSLMGVYGATPDVGITVQNFAQPARLCFAFMGRPETGKFLFEAELRGPAGRIQAASVPSKLDFALEGSKGSFVAVFWFPNVVFPKPDRYTVILRVDGRESFSGTFEIASPQARTPATPPQRSN